MGILQKGVVDLLRTTDTGAIYNVKDQLNGWNIGLEHKLFKNDYTDVHTINAPPDLAQKVPDDQHFIYCEYLPAGHHQFIIYDPLSDEFFTHDFILGMNSKDVFTDFPRKEEPEIRERPQVWSQWHENTEKDIEAMYVFDASSLAFEPDIIIKDQE